MHESPIYAGRHKSPYKLSDLLSKSMLSVNRDSGTSAVPHEMQAFNSYQPGVIGEYFSLMSVVNISAWSQWSIFQPDVSIEYFSLMSVVTISACQRWLFQPDVSDEYFSMTSVVTISAWCQWWIFQSVVDIFQPNVSGDYFSMMSVVTISVWCQWSIFQTTKLFPVSFEQKLAGFWFENRKLNNFS